jgi:transposase-like protein
MKQARKHYTPQETVAILRRHLLEKVPVSDLCQELGLHPSLFYHWLKEFFEHGAAAFEPRSRGGKPQQEAQQRRIAALEAKLRTKDEAERPYRVLAELMEEHVALKKSLGEI